MGEICDIWDLLQKQHRNQFTLIRMAIIKNQEVSVGRYMEKPFWVWRECELVQLLWKAVWQFLKKI